MHKLEVAKRLADGMADAYVEAALILSGQGDSFEHRLRCAFSTWALMGFMQRWLSLTDRPIPEMLLLESGDFSPK